MFAAREILREETSGDMARYRSALRSCSFEWLGLEPKKRSHSPLQSRGVAENAGPCSTQLARLLRQIDCFLRRIHFLPPTACGEVAGIHFETSKNRSATDQAAPIHSFECPEVHSAASKGCQVSFG